jgi:ABC-type Fe3+-hydroxamate transport system substrate-binding protein
MRRFVDQMGREVLLKDVPKRIVSLVPSQTELLFDLGLKDEVVGITKFCVHPQSWYKTKNRVGGTKKVSVASVKDLNPDLIIANKEENTLEDIRNLEKIAPVWISDINNFNDALEMIQEIGIIVNRHEEATNLVAEIRKSFENTVTIGKQKTALYFIWKQPYMCAGKGTFIDAMLSEIGLENLMSLERYPSIETPFQFPEHPDLVLLSSEPYPFNENDVSEMKKHFPNAEVRIVDGEMFSWYGSRMLYATTYFRSLFTA